jgi:membrane-bound lytic murein transglycosylase A
MPRSGLSRTLAATALAALAIIRPDASWAAAVATAGLDTTVTRADTSGFRDLEGWAQEDHAAALRMFLATCDLARDGVTVSVCRRAKSLGDAGEESSRQFLEHNFQLRVQAAPGLLTAYFTPLYEARAQADDEFSAPLRPRPVDLPRRKLGDSQDHYADRQEIEARPAPDALAWMRPEDLFFLQIQGSGVLSFPGGTQLRAVFDGSNGAPFLGIAAPMRRAGLLADEDTSAERIRAWLSANRGPRADAVMQLNRRYVFFRLEPDDGVEPAGAAGLRLTPGHAVAVDPLSHPMGELLWLDATAATLNGAFPAYRRFAVALDTGGAIKGGARVDLYMGRGADAGLEAGRVRHKLRLYSLKPLEQPDP